MLIIVNHARNMISDGKSY